MEPELTYAPLAGSPALAEDEEKDLNIEIPAISRLWHKAPASSGEGTGEDNLSDVDDEPALPAGRELQGEVEEGPKQLMWQGNAAFRRHVYEEAIELYSRLLQENPPDSTLALSNRCAAFCRLSLAIKQIPAAQSERRALYGLDPTSLAQLAVRDAEKVIQGRPTWPKAYYRHFSALLLMEQYDAARKTLLDGLHLDPSSKLLQKALYQLASEEAAAMPLLPPGTAERHRRQLERSDDFDCSLCLKLLYSPVTTPCGHSFCRSCLSRALDHGNRCPVCRTVLFVSSQSYPVSVTLNNIIEKSFPEEFEERKLEMASVASLGIQILPMFVMDVVLPSQKMALNIFEPRYRLMVRRIMEGNHRMGMVGLDRNTRNPADVACEVEVTECEPLPDGRFFLAVEGRRRCKVVRSWEQDGYRVAQVEWLEDKPVPPGSNEAVQLDALAATASELAQNWVAHARETNRSSRRPRLADVLRHAGEIPPRTQPELLSFWLANLLPTSPGERLEFLRTESTVERLSGVMDHLRGSQSQSCRLQ